MTMTERGTTKRSAADGLASTVRDDLYAILGDKGCISDAERIAPYLVDRRGDYVGFTSVVARPKSTLEVSEVVRVCARAGVGIVPQGGNTGLVGGSIPDESGDQILLSLERMSRIRGIDPLNFTMTVEAGCILADVQAAAEQAGLLFPLSLAAEGSCRIGGNLATNAGGTGVIRYGNARDLVLGLEVVLANGDIWDGLRGLRKDNTGYCLKQLFVGSEGTLGIITAAVVKLFPRPRRLRTVFIAVASAKDANRLLGRCRQASADTLSAFEYIHRNCLDLVFKHIPGCRDPLASKYEHYVLADIDGGDTGSHEESLLQGLLEEALAGGEVLDATIAHSLEQAESLWRLREAIPEAARAVGAGIRHDVSVPVSRVWELLEEGTALVGRIHPKTFLIPFGHLGDGNIHFNMVKPDGVSDEEFSRPRAAVAEGVYELVQRLGGSFSAEHGIGRQKRDALIRYRPAVELDLMRAIKRALDPNGVLNPGKVL